MIRIGLTGSIGMGKSTTAAMFAAAGLPVYDADAAVHRLYAGPAVAPVEARFPGVARDGRVDRAQLGRRVLGDADAIRELEAIVHPLVREDERAFLERAVATGHRCAVLDIPLLLETGRAASVEVVVVCSAPADTQRARVLARPEMTAEKFEAIAARQMSDSDKRRRAHFVVETGRGLAPAERAVEAIVRAVALMA